MTTASAARRATDDTLDLMVEQGTFLVATPTCIIAVRDDPLTDIEATERVKFVMKGGQVFHHDHG